MQHSKELILKETVKISTQISIWVLALYRIINFRAKRGSSLFEGGWRGSERKRATERVTEARPSEARETVRMARERARPSEARETPPSTTERSEGDHQPPLRPSEARETSSTPPRPSVAREAQCVAPTTPPRFVGFQRKSCSSS